MGPDAAERLAAERLAAERLAIERLAIERLATTAALERIAPEWWALWARCPEATPFHAPAWLLPWWHRFGTGELVAIALREAGRLVGLAPLYAYPGTADDAGPRLLPLGAGLSDYLGALLAPDAPPGAADRLLAEAAAVAAALPGGPLPIELPWLRADDPLLAARTPAGWRDDVGDHEPCLVLPLPPPPGKIWRRVRYYRRYAERLGPVTIAPAYGDELDESLEALFALHGARWRARDEPGVLDAPGVRAFHRDAAPELHARGILRLWTLRAGGRIVAACHTLAAHRRCHYYLGGFDPALERHSLGTVLLGHAVERAAAEGMRAFDFLRGLEDYKRQWAPVERWTRRRVLRPAETGAVATAPARRSPRDRPDACR